MEKLLNQITVNVTQQDINRGIKMACLHCPVSLALTRSYNSKESIFVGGADYFVKNRVYRLPQELKDFIHKFDNGFEVKPFTLTFQEVFLREFSETAII